MGTKAPGVSGSERTEGGREGGRERPGEEEEEGRRGREGGWKGKSRRYMYMYMQQR